MESMLEALNVMFEDDHQDKEVIKEAGWLKEGVWLKEEEVSEMVESLLKDNEAYFVDIAEENKMKIQEVASDDIRSVVENTLHNQDVVKSVIVLDDEKDDKNVVNVINLDGPEEENRNGVTEYKAGLDWNWWKAHPVALEHPVASENVNYLDYNWWYEDEMMWYSYPKVEFP